LVAFRNIVTGSGWIHFN